MAAWRMTGMWSSLDTDTNIEESWMQSVRLLVSKQCLTRALFFVQSCDEGPTDWARWNNTDSVPCLDSIKCCATYVSITIRH